mmetsp:Transcript_16498/g.17161  ORF Transcript_16498/g.17161 Transcript_16498/m.17161 type:complete len:166 (+) Transcript_16498:29-526(+)
MKISVTRLNREYNQYLKNRENLIQLEENFRCKINLSLRGDGSSVFNWLATMTGPKDSPYEGGVFDIMIDVPEEYPLKPPKCRFSTKIFHPNIHLETGEICHELFKDKWSPSCSIETVCKSILDLMIHPNEESPLNCDAGNLLRYQDLVGYYYIAKMYTLDCASPN